MLRYDANRDDFSYRNASRARVIAQSGRVRVLMDERNRNRWRVCADLELPARLAERGPQWLADARLGVTAATGVSSDVHDVVSLETFSDSRAHDKHLNSGWRKFVPGGDAAAVDEARLQKIEDMINWMTFKLEHLGHVFEHSTAAFRNAVDRGEYEFENLVDDEYDRMFALDDVVEEQTLKKVEDRFNKLQSDFELAFDEKVNHQHTGLASSIDRNLDTTVKPFDGAWQTPFQILLWAHAVFVVGAFLVFNNLKSFI